MDSAAVQKTPATVITGFLGAGKTTLIRHLLENAQGRRIALIINEFGDIGVDGDLLRDCGEETCSREDLIELTNGCICCTVADDFIPTMQTLLEKDRHIDHIIIETSGLALPQPLVHAFNWPGIRERVTVDGVVTVVDASAVADGRFADDPGKLAEQRRADPALDHESPLEELFEDQLGCADLVVLNKVDLIDTAPLERIEAEIGAAVSRPVKLVRSRQGNLPVEVLLGLHSASEAQIDARKSHHERDLENGEEHNHDDFDSFVVETRPIEDIAAFLSGLQSLIATHDILRAKGFVAVAGKPMRLVVQCVGKRVDHYYDREWEAGEAIATRLVVIGLKGMNQQEIASGIANLSVS